MVIKSSSVPDCAVYDNYDSSSGNEDDRCTVSRLLKIIYFCTGGVVIRSYKWVDIRSDKWVVIRSVSRSISACGAL